MKSRKTEGYMSRAGVLVIGIVMMVGCSGCQYTDAVMQVSRTALKSIFLTGQDIGATNAFQVYELQPNGVMAEVQYLVNLVRFSPCKFWRNDQVFTSAQAAEWLEYKTDKFENEISSAEDFIEKVASYSRTTGKEYYLIGVDNQKYPVKQVLYNELYKLRQYTQTHNSLNVTSVLQPAFH